jgi:hypothetical protein
MNDAHARRPTPTPDAIFRGGVKTGNGSLLGRLVHEMAAVDGEICRMPRCLHRSASHPRCAVLGTRHIVEFLVFTPSLNIVSGVGVGRQHRP